MGKQTPKIEWVDDHDLVNERGQWIDTFRRPYVRLNEPTVEIGFSGAPNLRIAYPSFEDWVGIYDPRHNSPEATNRQRYLDFRFRHQRGVMSLLNKIAASQVGKVVLEEVRLTYQRIRLLPYHAIPAPFWSSSHGAIAQMRVDDLLQFIGDFENYSGTDTDIFIQPPFTARGGNGGILVHELAHAIRNGQGFKDRNIRLNKRWDNEEEFAATMVYNTYLSEVEPGFAPVTYDFAELSDPEGFLDLRVSRQFTARAMLILFRTAQPRFFKGLAGVPTSVAKFNPFRQLAKETVEAELKHNARMFTFEMKHPTPNRR